MPTPAEIERLAHQHVQRGDFRSAYDLLGAQPLLTARATHQLALCHSKLHPDKPAETLALYDRAEALGFDDYWLYYHRWLLLLLLGHPERALHDCLKLLAHQPPPREALAGAVRALSLMQPSDTVTQLLNAIWHELDRLHAQIALSQPNIVRVEKGDFDAFVYQGDAADFPSPQARMLPEARLTPHEFVESWDPARQDLVLLLVAWYLTEGHPVAFLDVGSNVGSDAIRVAKLSALFGESFPIASFEPGLNAALLPHTLKLNGLADRVTFHEICVSDSDHPVVLFGEPGISVNNRIVNRNFSTEGFSRIVQSTTLDCYLLRPEFEHRHPVAKVDTQGAEGLIWRGMQSSVRHRQFSLVMEITPWALASTVAPQHFLEELLAVFHIFNLGSGRQRFTAIDRPAVPHFLDDVAGAEPHWTDILCVSRALPTADRLIERIAAGYAPRSS